MKPDDAAAAPAAGQRPGGALDPAHVPDAPLERSLRPQRLSDFTGQARTVERLEIMTGAARARGDCLGHILLSGPPGLGKTTLALILAREMGVKAHVTSGPVIERPGDLAGMLTNLEAGDVLFIDEIHRIPRAVEEYLYSAMEDFRLDILLDQGPNARSVRLELPRFSLVGATTRLGLLTAPLRSRFTLQTRLDYYPRGVLTTIVQRSAGLLDIPILADGAAAIAARARGTPRLANNHLAFARDFVQQRGLPRLDAEAAAAALELLEIDAYGLDEMDKRLLGTLARNFAGGPTGLSSLAAAVAEEAHTLEEVHEPFLIQEGWLQRTPQGRVLTPRARALFGGAAPPESQDVLPLS